MTTPDERYGAALWYAWGRIDSGQYGDKLHTDHGEQFGRIQRKLETEYSAGRIGFMESIRNAWEVFAEAATDKRPLKQYAKERAGYSTEDTPAEPRRSAYTDDAAGDAAYRRACEKWARYDAIMDAGTPVIQGGDVPRFERFAQYERL